MSYRNLGVMGKRDNRLARNNGQRQYIYKIEKNGVKKLIKTIYHTK